MIDRIQPTRRPSLRVCGWQQWRSLLFLHWSVPADKIRALLPESLELDLLDGNAYVGVVPFAMRDVRPRLWPRGLGFDFLETNVRTYVLHDGRPGVYFFSLDAASWLAVCVARRLWGLPYYHADMQLEQQGDTVLYQSVRRTTRARHAVRYRVGPSLGPSTPDSLEFFLLERYLLFVERRKRLFMGQVYHTPYPAQRAEVLELADDLLVAAGFDCPADLPDLAHYSAGVDVQIFPLQACSALPSTDLEVDQ